MTSLVSYHPEAYSITGEKLMGRHVAGNSFLHGYLEHSKEAIGFFADKEEFLVQLNQDWKVSLEQKKMVSATWGNINSLLNANLYIPGPNLPEYCWKRELISRGAFSITGITHTTASANAMDQIVGLLTAPIQPWDALICTSSAVEKTVKNVLQLQIEYLKDRFGITKATIPALPVIPLGINVNDFIYSNQDRINSRRKLGIDDNSLVVLFVGRMSFHAKAHPLVMYQALNQLSKKYSITLIECGWFSNDYICNAFEEAFKHICGNRIRRIFLDGRIKENRDFGWASADIFTSFSDNVQETFGITPLEAMAASLPLVVADWDGYKDTVVDGQVGFRVPTIQLAAGETGRHISKQHALGLVSYDRYIGELSQCVYVDLNKAVDAFDLLLGDQSLRYRMGLAGRKFVCQNYDWSRIIARYEDLWASLDAIRLQYAGGTTNWPARHDPFEIFASYPTGTLKTTSIVSLTKLHNSSLEASEYLLGLMNLSMVNYIKEKFLLSKQQYELIFGLTTCPGISLIDLYEPFKCEVGFDRFQKNIIWLGKLGILKLT